MGDAKFISDLYSKHIIEEQNVAEESHILGNYICTDRDILAISVCLFLFLSGTTAIVFVDKAICLGYNRCTWRNGCLYSGVFATILFVNRRWSFSDVYAISRNWLDWE